MNHETYMREALIEAEKARDKGEVPIGAVVVRYGEIVGRGHNLRETDKDPTAHAEMIAIRDASKNLGGWRLTDCSLYVTIEPCPMCAGAIYQSRIVELVYGAPDLKAGAAGTLYNIVQDERLNHRMNLISGVLQDESATMMKDFFRKLRTK